LSARSPNTNPATTRCSPRGTPSRRTHTRSPRSHAHPATGRGTGAHGSAATAPSWHGARNRRRGAPPLPLGAAERRICPVQAVDSPRCVPLPSPCRRGHSLASTDGRHGRVSVRADNGARSDGTGSVGAFPPFLWTFLFKQAKHIPSDIRPPVRRDNLSRREGGNRPRFPLRLVQESSHVGHAAQIHIDLLPRLNRLLLSPAGTLLVTLSLVPLARLVYYWGASCREKGLAFSCFQSALRTKRSARCDKGRTADPLVVVMRRRR
jgi:hypothetical protein